MTELTTPLGDQDWVVISYIPVYMRKQGIIKSTLVA